MPGERMRRSARVWRDCVSFSLNLLLPGSVRHHSHHCAPPFSAALCSSPVGATHPWSKLCTDTVLSAPFCLFCTVRQLMKGGTTVSPKDKSDPPQRPPTRVRDCGIASDGETVCQRNAVAEAVGGKLLQRWWGEWCGVFNYTARKEGNHIKESSPWGGWPVAPILAPHYRLPDCLITQRQSVFGQGMCALAMAMPF